MRIQGPHIIWRYKLLEVIVCQKSAKQSFLCEVEVIFEPFSATMCFLIHRAGIECHQGHLRMYLNRGYALPNQYNSHSRMISGLGNSPHHTLSQHWIPVNPA